MKYEIVPDQEHLFGTCGWLQGRAWHHNHKLNKKVWSSPTQAKFARKQINNARNKFRSDKKDLLVGLAINK